MPLVTSTNVLALAATRVVLAVIVERTMVGLDDIVVQDGKPDPALVKTCPLVPAAPLRVSAVVKFADAIVGAVSVLFVRVWVAAIPATVSVTAGSDSTLLPDTAGACSVTDPLVSPAITIELIIYP